jgi:hypothetical protein
MGLPMQPCTAQAKEEKEALKAKGCASKRKAEEDGPLQKELAAVVVREQNQGADATTDEVVWDDGNDYDSDDDVETVIAKVNSTQLSRGTSNG